MSTDTFQINNFKVGNNQPLFLIAGPCVIESELLVMKTATVLKEISEELKIGLIFKSSFDKANRTSVDSFRGLGIDKSLKILKKVQQELELPVLTDVHDDSPLDEVADVVDVLQTPAFLVRQTNFIQRVCRLNKPVNIKKGQFQAPGDMVNVIKKGRVTGNQRLMVCDRGVSFGYNALISDMCGLVTMRKTEAPVIFDATHSVQKPGGLGKQSGGSREMVATLARASVAVGIAGIFMETHPEPGRALCDGATMLPLSQMRDLLIELQAHDAIAKSSVL